MATNRKVAEVARYPARPGFRWWRPKGTSAAIAAAGVPVETVKKVQEGRPNIVDTIKDGQIALVINTVEEKRGAVADSSSIRTRGAAGTAADLHHNCRRQGRAGRWASRMARN